MEPRRALRVRLRGVGDDHESTYLLEKGETVIGSSGDSDFLVRTAGVSRRHARVVFRSQRLFVEDLGSKNGTHLNGRSVIGCEIRPGDWLQLGPATFRVEAVDGADLEIAVRGTPAAPDLVEEAVDEDLESETDLGLEADGAPADWIPVIAEFASIVFSDRPSRLEIALRKATERLGALGLFACEISSSGSRPVVLGLAGLVEIDWIADQGATMPALVEEAVALGRGQDVEIAHVADVETEVSWALVSSPGMGSIVVAVVGGFSGMRHSQPLLVALAHIVAASSRGARVDHSTRVPEASSLQMIDGFVVGSSPAMEQLLHMVARFNQGDVPILLQGETGVGKELVARLIHATSDRAGGPFVAINCAAIPSELLEAELFGVRRGVATGVDERIGVFESASGGVVFLDEIGDMPLNLQAKLLRLLQSMEVLPLGARTPVPVDVRVVSATNTDIQEEIKQGRFRKDLYFRLAGFELRVPPLRERREDIPDLLAHFMNVFADEIGKSVRGITIKALSILENASWPGNVRELMNEVRRMVYLCQPGEAIDSSLVSATIQESAADSRIAIDDATESLDMGRNVEVLERRLITMALNRTKGNRSRAARLLGISRNGLTLKIQRLGIVEEDSHASLDQHR
jgi:DNA-binding NtrC family response regulator